MWSLTLGNKSLGQNNILSMYLRQHIADKACIYFLGLGLRRGSFVADDGLPFHDRGEE